MVGPGGEPQQDAPRIHVLLYKAPGFASPGTQLVWAGPHEVFTGINTSAKYTEGILDLATLSCFPVSWFEA